MGRGPEQSYGAAAGDNLGFKGKNALPMKKPVHDALYPSPLAGTRLATRFARV